MPTDTNDTNDKELVLTAISALKARGAEINAHTVAQEAQISRSRLYRDNEIMELITEEGSNSNGGAEMAEDNAQKRITELEERIIELEETIWNLEKAAETFEKKQQDAYHSGFQKGVEEATRRYTSQSHLIDSAKVDDEQFTMSPMTFGSFEERGQGEELQIDTGPLPAVSAMNSMSLSDSEFIYEPPVERQLRPASLPFELDFSSPDMSDFPATDDSTAGGDESAEGNHDDKQDQEETIPPETVVKTGDYEPYKTNYSFKPEETPDEDEDSHFASEYNFGGGSLTSDMEYDFSALAKQSQAESRPTMSAEAALQSSLQDETAHVKYDRVPRDPDAIYNVARSGPTTGREYNPLVELSWKDLQNVYNFSVASLKDYARTGVLQSNPVKHRMDPALGSVSMPGAAPPGAAPPSIPSAKQAEPALRQPYPEYDLGPSTNDPNRTGDRLQALSDPRNLFDTDAVVDLDALDIFDDLDDYVDLDKIEIINDVQTQPKEKDKPIGAGGDELRELIKGRIKQAAEMPHEQVPLRGGMGAGMGGGMAAGMGAAAPAPNKEKIRTKIRKPEMHRPRHLVAWLVPSKVVAHAISSSAAPRRDKKVFLHRLHRQ